MNNILFNMPVLPVENEPLFTFDLYKDENTDHKTGEKYYLCVISQWSDKTVKAREIGHKSFYINGAFSEIRGFFDRIKNNDNEMKKIFDKPENTRLYITKTENYKVTF